MKIFMISLIALVLTLNLSCADNKPGEFEKTHVDTTVSIEKEVSEIKPVSVMEVTKKQAVDKVTLQDKPVKSKTNQTLLLVEDVVEKDAKISDPIEETESNEVKVDPDSSSAIAIEENLNDQEVAPPSEEILVDFKADHSAFDELLSKYVSASGVVNYKGLKSEIDKVNSYLSELDQNPISSDWSRNEQLAYWINVYNAFTIKLILDNYPVSSIQDIANGKPWDLKWIKLGGETYSLNQIENEIIRPQFNEPRIHFAVNCAAQSCPPLANRAFTAENLDGLLDKQTKAFINNNKYNKIDGSSVKISKIFDWYSSDFGNKVVFLNKYLDKSLPASTSFDYTDYNWSLNDK